MPSVTKRFEGAKMFRHRLVCAILSCTPIRITNIRPNSNPPGLLDHEVNFLRLLDSLTNGTRLKINETGTKVDFRPGFIVGSDHLIHKCVTSRGIGYWIEAILPLLLFAKTSTKITFTDCCTNHDLDLTVDTIRNAVFPCVTRFLEEGEEDGLELKLKRRGVLPLGGGEVILSVPMVRKSLEPIDFTDVGKVKRIRGLCYTVRMAANTANRVGIAARGVLNNLLPDVWIFTEHHSGKSAGKSPGFGLSLSAETTEGAIITVEHCAPQGAIPEDFGKTVVHCLLEELSFGGCVDSCVQSVILLLMVLTPEDVSRVRLGRLSPFTMDVLRTIKEFFGTVFKLREDNDSNSVVCSCLGTGLVNFNKTAC